MKTVVEYIKEGLGPDTAGLNNEFYTTFVNRLVAVENNTVPYEREIQRDRIISYLQAVASTSIPKPFTYYLFEKPQRTMEQRIFNTERGLGALKFLATKSSIDINALLKGSDRLQREINEGYSEGVENPEEYTVREMAQILTDDAYLNPVKEEIIQARNIYYYGDGYLAWAGRKIWALLRPLANVFNW